MDKNPFEKIAGYASADIEGLLNTIKKTKSKKIDDGNPTILNF